MFRSPALRALTLLSLVVSPALEQIPLSNTSERVAENGFPFPEKLVYHVEWRLITAGTATLDLKPGADHKWQTNLEIESAGVLSRLYRVLDSYRVTTDAKFCLQNSELDAQESKRHVISHITVGNPAGKLKFEERDLVKNSTSQKDLDVPPCTREIAGALASLRVLPLDVGKSTTIPVTDGKKVVSAKIESQVRETLIIDGKQYQTVRYEAFLFDNVLYHRKGRLFLWLSENPDRIPIQIRIQLGFPIGNVTVQLDKEQRNQA